MVKDYPSKAAYDAADDAYIKALFEWDKAENAAEAAAAKVTQQAAEAQRRAEADAQRLADQAAKDADAQARAERFANRLSCGDVLPLNPPWSTGYQPGSDSIYCKTGPGSLPSCNTVDTTTDWCFLHDGMGQDDIHGPGPLVWPAAIHDGIKIRDGIWYDCWTYSTTVWHVDPDANAFSSTLADVNASCTPINS